MYIYIYISAFNQLMLFVIFVLCFYVIKNEFFQCQFNVCIKKVYYIIIDILYNMNVCNEALINKIRHVIKTMLVPPTTCLIL